VEHVYVLKRSFIDICVKIVC